MAGFFARRRARARLEKLRATIDSDRPSDLQTLLKDDDGVHTAELLQHACDVGERSQCVRILLDSGWRSAVNEKDPQGHTPLHLAVGRGDPDTVKVLLEAGANPNLQDNDGVTPLTLAKSYAGMGEVADLLLKAGADPRILDKHGKEYLM